MFFPNIHTFYDLKVFEASHKGLLMHEGLELLLKNKEVSFIYDMRACNTFALTDQGLWISYKKGKNRFTYSKFIDFFNRKISRKEIPISFSDVSNIAGNYIIGIQWEYLFIYDLNKEEEKKMVGRYNPGKAFSKSLFVVRESFKDEIQCYDISLNLMWSKKITKQCYTSNIEQGPQSYNDLVIVNVGEEPKQPRGDFELNAYRIEDGTMAWQVILPTTPHCSNVIGDKIYITIRDRLMVMDAGNGKTLVDAPHHLGSDGYHYLFPFKDLLIAACEATAKINVFSKDGMKLLQEINIADPLSVLARRQPVECDDRLYLVLANRDMLQREAASYLLELIPDNSQPKQVNVELPQRPPFWVSRLTMKTGEHEHLVTISHDNLDEIILYGTIILKEIILEVCNQIDPRKSDDKHNGKLHFVVDPEPLPEGTRDSAISKLQVIAERISWHADRYGKTAGKKKKPFKVLIELK